MAFFIALFTRAQNTIKVTEFTQVVLETHSLFMEIIIGCQIIKTSLNMSYLFGLLIQPLKTCFHKNNDPSSMEASMWEALGSLSLDLLTANSCVAIIVG